MIGPAQGRWVALLLFWAGPMERRRLCLPVGFCSFHQRLYVVARTRKQDMSYNGRTGGKQKRRRQDAGTVWQLNTPRSKSYSQTSNALQESGHNRPDGLSSQVYCRLYGVVLMCSACAVVVNRLRLGYGGQLRRCNTTAVGCDGMASGGPLMRM